MLNEIDRVLAAVGGSNLLLTVLALL